MQVRPNIIQRVKVYVMNNLARLGPCNPSMLKVSATTLRPISQAVVPLGQGRVGASRPFSLFIGVFGQCQRNGDRCNHAVSAPNVNAVWRGGFLPLVGIKRVSVAVQHLVVTVAKFFRYCRPIAVCARTTDNLAAPSILCRSVPLDSLVVHEAEAVSGMSPVASLDAANARSSVLSHLWIVSGSGEVFSMAVPVIRWLGRRIEMVLASRSRGVA